MSEIKFKNKKLVNMAQTIETDSSLKSFCFIVRTNTLTLRSVIIAALLFNMFILSTPLFATEKTDETKILNTKEEKLKKAIADITKELENKKKEKNISQNLADPKTNELKNDQDANLDNILNMIHTLKSDKNQAVNKEEIVSTEVNDEEKKQGILESTDNLKLENSINDIKKAFKKTTRKEEINEILKENQKFEEEILRKEKYELAKQIKDESKNILLKDNIEKVEKVEKVEKIEKIDKKDTIVEKDITEEQEEKKRSIEEVKTLSLKEEQAKSREIGAKLRREFREKLAKEEELKKVALKKENVTKKEINKKEIQKKEIEQKEIEQKEIEQKEAAKKIREAAIKKANDLKKENNLKKANQKQIIERAKQLVKKEVLKDKKTKVIKNEKLVKKEKKSLINTNNFENNFENEFKKEKSKKYTLSILTLSQKRELKTLKAIYNLEKDIYTYKLKNDGKRYYKVLYGVYDSKQEAKKDIKNLHKTLRNNGVSVNSISKHQKLFKKYNKNKIIEKKLIEDNLSTPNLEKEFKTRTSNRYTISILTLSNYQESIDIKKEYDLKNDVLIYKLPSKGKIYYKVLYGVYESSIEAKNDIKNLHIKLRNNSPYVNKISKHQKLFKKYNLGGVK